MTFDNDYEVNIIYRVILKAENDCLCFGIGYAASDPNHLFPA